MNRILSWKISTGTYAYIYLPNSSSRISSRIPEDSPIWPTILNAISGWDKSKYKAEFDKMAAEVEGKYGVKLSWKDEYFNFGDNGATNIVLLAGKDGVDGSNGGSSNNGDSSDGGTWDEAYDEFNKTLDEKLDGVREDIERKNEEVKDFVESELTQTVLEATQTINNTKKELDNIRKDLEEKLGDAAEALNKAAALFEMGEGGIDGEAIKGALSSVKEYGSWLEEYSGCVQSLKTDYDIATNRMGSVGEAEDVKDGLFARFATSLNVISGTVGNVERDMKASEGSIKDMASWYDAYASATTEVVRFMSASGDVIGDTISHISDTGDNGYTAFLKRQMDAKDAAIKDVIMTETRSGITNITRDMNALSGTISDNIARLSEIDGTLTSIGRKMDAKDFTMEQYMTKTDSALTTAINLRDHWSAESGKISTVASLTAQVDGEGNVMYFVSGSTGSESDDIRVWKGDDGVWRDANGVKYKEEDVIVHYSNMMASYIQQQTSAITMSVIGEGNLSAAIKLAISEDSSIISMVAKEVVIDADVIANAISAKAANIGGILIGDGKIKSVKDKGGLPLFLLDGSDGSLYAQNAVIEGTVRATSGKIGGFTVENNQLVGSGDTAVLKGGVSYNDEEDVFKIGLNKSKKIVFYAYKSSGSTMDSSSISPVSSETKYKRIYIMQPTIEEGDEPVGYYTNNDYDGIPPAGTILNKFLKFSAETLTAIDVNPSKNWWNTALKNKKKNVLRLEARVPATGWGNQAAGSYTTRYEFYTRDSSGDYDVTAETCYLSGLPIYNTTISSNGIISCDSINASNGFYGGTINSDGKFTGELECNKGSLNNISLKNTEFNGPLFFNCGATLYATDTNGKRYLTISPYKVDDTSQKKYPNASYYRNIKNSNGNNNGKYYYAGTSSASITSMFDIMVNSGSVIEIPPLNLTVWRYIPTARTGKSGIVNVKYALGNITENLITLNVPSQTKGSTTFTGSSDTKVITATTDCRLIIYISYNLHLPTYYWLGADKAALSITLDSASEDKSEITVTPKGAVTEGMLIGSDGFMIRAGTYGLKVTQSGGIQKYNASNGWTAL